MDFGVIENLTDHFFQLLISHNALKDSHGIVIAISTTMLAVSNDIVFDYSTFRYPF